MYKLLIYYNGGYSFPCKVFSFATQRAAREAMNYFQGNAPKTLFMMIIEDSE